MDLSDSGGKVRMVDLYSRSALPTDSHTSPPPPLPGEGNHELEPNTADLKKTMPPLIKNKSRVFYGKEPPGGESTTTECGFNYQLLTVIYRSSPMGSF